MSKKKNVSADLLGNLLKAARQKYETDPKLETQTGIDIEVSGVGTFTILRAHGRNQKFINSYRQHVVPYLDSAEAKDRKQGEPDNKLESLNRQVFCDSVIVGLKDIDGNKIPYETMQSRLCAIC